MDGSLQQMTPARVSGHTMTSKEMSSPIAADDRQIKSSIALRSKEYGVFAAASNRIEQRFGVSIQVDSKLEHVENTESTIHWLELLGKTKEDCSRAAVSSNKFVILYRISFIVNMHGCALVN